jgi:hypothetical protein
VEEDGAILNRLFVTRKNLFEKSYKISGGQFFTMIISGIVWFENFFWLVSAILPKVRLAESSFGRTTFDRKILSLKGHLIGH